MAKDFSRENCPFFIREHMGDVPECPRARSRRGEVKRKINEALLQSCFNGLTLQELVEKTGKRKGSIERALRRGLKSGEYHREVSKDGERRYFDRRCYEILKVLENVLIKLHEGFLKTPMALNPSMSRIITPGYLAERVFRELERRNEQLIKDITVEHLENLISENREKIEREFIYTRGLRVRIGGINYP